MNLTPNMELLLKAILADVKRLESMPDQPGPATDRDDWRQQYLERQEYRQCGVRHDLEHWLGCPPSRSDSAVFSRTLRQMEDMGLLVRVNRWGPSCSRTTHVQLTPLGRTEAERLVAEQEAALARFLADAAVSLGDRPQAAEKSPDGAGN